MIPWRIHPHSDDVGAVELLVLYGRGICPQQSQRRLVLHEGVGVMLLQLADAVLNVKVPAWTSDELEVR